MEGKVRDLSIAVCQLSICVNIWLESTNYGCFVRNCLFALLMTVTTETDIPCILSKDKSFKCPGHIFNKDMVSVSENHCRESPQSKPCSLFGGLMKQSFHISTVILIVGAAERRHSSVS